MADSRIQKAKKWNLMEYAMKRVAAGANLPTSEIWACHGRSKFLEGRCYPKGPLYLRAWTGREQRWGLGPMGIPSELGRLEIPIIFLPKGDSEETEENARCGLRDHFLLC